MVKGGILKIIRKVSFREKEQPWDLPAFLIPGFAKNPFSALPPSALSVRFPPDNVFISFAPPKETNQRKGGLREKNGIKFGGKVFLP